MNWLDSTEIVAGFVIRSMLSSDAVNPLKLYPPYGEIISVVRAGKELPDIIAKIGFDRVDTAIHASERVNGTLSPADYLRILEESYLRETNIAKIRRELDKGITGKEMDTGAMLQAISNFEVGMTEMTPMSDVKEIENPWIKTGYKPVDDNLNGIPDAGLTIIGAVPGIGKTSLMLKIVAKMVKTYPKKKAAIFTLEMLMSQLTKRMLEEEKLKKDEKARILLTDSAFSIHEIYTLASRLAASEDLSVIAIDFADLIVEGEQTESQMGAIYRQLSLLAKRTGIPVILIVQLGRNTYAAGGIPKINHIRYSSLAEAMSALILLIYNPNQVFADFREDATLVAQDTAWDMLL